MKGWSEVSDASALLGAEPAQRLMDWLVGTVAAPAPELGRPGALCPFVRPSLDARKLFAVVVPGSPESTATETAVRRETQAFLNAAPTRSDPRSVHKSLLIVLPDAQREQEVTTLVARIKLDLIRSGMTCGEFYPQCDDRSVRNGEVKVATSPMPLIALRYLTKHDELFLRSQPQYYPSYQEWRSHAERSS
ncbi:DUF6875 domain-containing protein [Actinoplanes sp. TFC3]|uniref:DUF6875 domain-containing protein n=1 Tax=Actinoplanes sp. TFC3 TaxID=1710355 RepID=UPI000834EA5C|nr:hypothetical protein [Actinoplanes sp. TFC3]